MQTPLMAIVSPKTVAKIDVKKIKGGGAQSVVIQTAANKENIIDELIDSFVKGWKVGTQIDGTYDLSDKLSDWAINTFGPHVGPF